MSKDNTPNNSEEETNNNNLGQEQNDDINKYSDIESGIINDSITNDKLDESFKKKKKKKNIGEIDIDEITIREIRENISRNSLEIADLKNKNISSNNSQNSDEPITPRSDYKPPKYVYANIYDEKLDDSNEWSDIKRYRFQKCLWKLKYNRIVSSFYLDNLKNSEHKWSWMIIVISTLTSGLTVANNVDEENAPIENYNTYINILLTTSSMGTSLIAAWIKKQMFIEKINGIDKYLNELNALCEELETQLSLLNTDRLKYNDFKKEYIPRMTEYLTANPIIPAWEWKKCIREITLYYPELLNIDDSEDNKMWPWYGDLIFDPKHDDEENGESLGSHVRYPTTFYRKFRKTKKDRLKSSCCGKNKHKNVYNNNP